MPANIGGWLQILVAGPAEWEAWRVGWGGEQKPAYWHGFSVLAVAIGDLAPEISGAGRQRALLVLLVATLLE